ncbi:hypothetical protein J437_LFUL010879 [Ladona fulva]|uniref:PiggyBac transposable element-derived protein domain-containing protein n=1 Tax=Ladona fulva TaxID=123851 RepID=A0A8K0KMR3_LADFU|nr:hypothetical protein J437_LFUL010879 [Ladona fulva]
MATSSKRSKLSDVTEEDIFGIEDSDSDDDLEDIYINTDVSDSDSDEEVSVADDDTAVSIPGHPYEWTAEEEEPRSKFPFIGNSGIKVEIVDCENVLEFFEIFVDDELCKMIADQTNIYAKQFIDSNPNLKPQSRARHWVETNSNEIRTLLGLFILQGIVLKPDYAMYFSKRESIATPFFAKVFPERRFYLLLKFLHFADNSTYSVESPGKKLFKIFPVLKYLGDRFSAVYIPNQAIVVDESLLMHLIDMAMLNAYALYKKKNGKLTRKEFIITLGEQLIEKYAQNLDVVKGRPSKSPRPTHFEIHPLVAFNSTRERRRKISMYVQES